MVVTGHSEVRIKRGLMLQVYKQICQRVVLKNGSILFRRNLNCIYSCIIHACINDARVKTRVAADEEHSEHAL